MTYDFYLLCLFLLDSLPVGSFFGINMDKHCHLYVDLGNACISNPPESPRTFVEKLPTRNTVL